MPVFLINSKVHKDFFNPNLNISRTKQKSENCLNTLYHYKANGKVRDDNIIYHNKVSQNQTSV